MNDDLAEEAASLFPSDPQQVHRSVPIVTGANKSPVLDENVLRGLQGFLPPAELASMYNEFLRLTQDRVELLRHEPSLDLVHRTTHTIFGTAGMLGACQIATRAYDLGTIADSHLPLATGVAQILDACDALTRALRAHQVIV